jgi:hypothetical protein
MVDLPTEDKNLITKGSIQAGMAFTDIVVVLGLVAVFSAVVFGVLGPSRIEDLREVRDLQRIEDLGNLSRAIKLSLVEGEVVLVSTSKCDDCASDVGSDSADGSGWIKFDVPEGKEGLGKYFDSLPVDPLNKGVYKYVFEADDKTQSFKISVQLESPTNDVKMRLDGGTSPELYEVGSDLSL